MKLILTIFLFTLGSRQIVISQINGNVTAISNILRSSQFNKGKYLNTSEASILVRLHSDVKNLPDSVSLGVTFFPNELTPDPESLLLKRPKNDMQWIIQSKEAVKIKIQSINLGNYWGEWIFEPGDSIIVNLNEGKLSFSGKGAEKLNLGNDIIKAIEKLKKPSNPTLYVTKSIEDFFEYNTFLNDQLDLIDSIMVSYRYKLSKYAYDYIRTTIIHRTEYDRNYKFYNLYSKYRKQRNNSNITSKQLCDTYDSAFFTKSANWMREQQLSFVGKGAYYDFIRTQILRKYNFSADLLIKDHLSEIFEEGKRQYSGLALESFLYTALTGLIIKEFGFTPETELILKRYTGDLKFPEYKKHLIEIEYQAGMFYPGKWAPDFEVSDLNGNKYNKSRVLGKLVLINFYNGNDCKKINEALKRIRVQFESDTDFVMLNIASPSFKIDGIKKKEGYLTIFDSSLLKAYGVYKSFELRLIGPQGRIVTNLVPSPLTNEKELVQLLRINLEDIKKEKWALQHDGPYVLTEGNSTENWYIIMNKRINSPRKNNKLSVPTDIIDRYFEVELKKEIKIEPAIYGNPSKLIALSDIEGEFEAFRKLLQSNKVIDENFNWIFGSGHLVLTGDIVDRGYQVTECLWLIYALEEKAKAAGGYVHLILGNHEIMNLSGNTHYVQHKYTENAHILGKEYSKDLYGENAELGKWLRSKNIIEKIGNLLFVHGGISEEINNLSLPIEKLNEMARPYYDKDSVARKSKDKALTILYSSHLSPFWFRSYYLKENMRIGIGANVADTTYKTSIQGINKVLSNFQVTKIVTGHTIYKVEDSYGQHITVHYKGKVINTDTKHAKGYSEALLIENDKYYRVDKEGKRSLLLEDKSTDFIDK